MTSWSIRYRGMGLCKNKEPGRLTTYRALVMLRLLLFQKSFLLTKGNTEDAQIVELKGIGI